MRFCYRKRNESALNIRILWKNDRTRGPNQRFFRRVVSLGSLGLGEAYMDGDFTAPVGGVDGLMTILVRNRLKHKTRVDPIFAIKDAAILVFNLFRSPASNVQAHYDLGDDLFESFLIPR